MLQPQLAHVKHQQPAALAEVVGRQLRLLTLRAGAQLKQVCTAEHQLFDVGAAYCTSSNLQIYHAKSVNLMTQLRCMFNVVNNPGGPFSDSVTCLQQVSPSQNRKGMTQHSLKVAWARRRRLRRRRPRRRGNGQPGHRVLPRRLR